MTRFWNVTQGTSRAKVRAEDYDSARERAQRISFTKPESIVLVEDETDARMKAICGYTASTQLWQFPRTAR